MESITFNIFKYCFFCICLIKIDYFQTIYYENFLNRLIIEFMKIGRNAEYLREMEKEESLKELNKIAKLFFEDMEE